MSVGIEETCSLDHCGEGLHSVVPVVRVGLPQQESTILDVKNPDRTLDFVEGDNGSWRCRSSSDTWCDQKVLELSSVSLSDFDPLAVTSGAQVKAPRTQSPERVQRS